MDFVFVYGTLKAGFPNAAINQGQQQGGVFKTVAAAELFLVGERYVPWLVFGGTDDTYVEGEVYKITKATLAEMDKLEQVEQLDGYQRVSIEVMCQDTKQTLRTYVYQKTSLQLAKANIRQGPLRCYLPMHAKLFVKRSS